MQVTEYCKLNLETSRKHIYNSKNSLDILVNHYFPFTFAIKILACL